MGLPLKRKFRLLFQSPQTCWRWITINAEPRRKTYIRDASHIGRGYPARDLIRRWTSLVHEPIQPQVSSSRIGGARHRCPRRTRQSGRTGTIRSSLKIGKITGQSVEGAGVGRQISRTKANRPKYAVEKTSGSLKATCETSETGVLGTIDLQGPMRMYTK